MDSRRIVSRRLRLLTQARADLPGREAVFSHTVDTTVTTREARTYRERESIIFRHLGDGNLLVVHEHLSTVPDAVPADESADAEPNVAEVVAQ